MWAAVFVYKKAGEKPRKKLEKIIDTEAKM